MSSSSPIDHSPAETMAETSTAQDSQDEEERRQKQARKDLVCQVFTLSWQHPIWQNLKKLVLRNLAHDMHRRITKLDETWAFSGLVSHPLPSMEYLDIAGNGSQGLTPAIFATLVSKHPRGHGEERTGNLIRNQLSLIHVLSTWLGSESLQKLVLCHAPKQSYLKWNYNPSRCYCNSPTCRAPGKTGPTLCWSCPLTRCPLGPHPVLTVLTCSKESREEKEYSSAATAGKAAATGASSSSSSRRLQITWTNCWSLNHPNTSLKDTGLSDRVTLLRRSLCKHEHEPMNDDRQPAPMEDDCQHVLFTSDDAEDASRQEVRRREAKERNQNKPKKKGKRRAHQDPLTSDLYAHPFFGYIRWNNAWLVPLQPGEGLGSGSLLVPIANRAARRRSMH
ncbi:hypothetical protein ACOMHN_020894 [Nucella lapillus]